MIDDIVREARRSGVSRQNIHSYVHKHAKHIVVSRYTDSGPGCSLPCAKCRDVLQLYDVRVSCVDHLGNSLCRVRVQDLPVTPYLTRDRR